MIKKVHSKLELVKCVLLYLCTCPCVYFCSVLLHTIIVYIYTSLLNFCFSPVCRLCLCVGNILVIVVVAATKAFHSMTSVLIINLAVSDLLVGAGVMPFVALSVMNHGWVDCTVCLHCSTFTSI